MRGTLYPTWCLFTIPEGDTVPYRVLIYNAWRGMLYPTGCFVTMLEGDAVPYWLLVTMLEGILYPTRYLLSC